MIELFVAYCLLIFRKRERDEPAAAACLSGQAPSFKSLNNNDGPSGLYCKCYCLYLAIVLFTVEISDRIEVWNGQGDERTSNQCAVETNTIWEEHNRIRQLRGCSSEVR